MKYIIPITTRWAESSHDALAIFELLKDMHAEVGQAPLVTNKALASVTESRHALMAFRGDRMVGSIGLFRAAWWFSDDEALFSQWAYVRPEERAGRALRAMLDEIIDLVEGESVPAYIHVYNGPGKAHARAAGRFVEVADEIAIMPSGRIFAIHKKG